MKQSPSNLAEPTKKHKVLILREIATASCGSLAMIKIDGFK
jgi:hypothetical protein